jgi:hypothetical protein
VLQLSGDGQVARLRNFQLAELWRRGRRQVWRSRGGIDKGHKLELDAFLAAVRAGGPMPIPLTSLLATSRATFAVGRSLGSGRLESIAASQGGLGR